MWLKTLRPWSLVFFFFFKVKMFHLKHNTFFSLSAKAVCRCTQSLGWSVSHWLDTCTALLEVVYVVCRKKKKKKKTLLRLGVPFKSTTWVRTEDFVLQKKNKKQLIKLNSELNLALNLCVKEEIKSNVFT